MLSSVCYSLFIFIVRLAHLVLPVLVASGGHWICHSVCLGSILDYAGIDVDVVPWRCDSFALSICCDVNASYNASCWSTRNTRISSYRVSMLG